MQIKLINAKLKLNELIEINCSVFCHFDHFLGSFGTFPGSQQCENHFFFTIGTFPTFVTQPS